MKVSRGVVTRGKADELKLRIAADRTKGGVILIRRMANGTKPAEQDAPTFPKPGQNRAFDHALTGPAWWYALPVQPEEVEDDKNDPKS